MVDEFHLIEHSVLETVTVHHHFLELMMSEVDSFTVLAQHEALPP